MQAAAEPLTRNKVTDHGAFDSLADDADAAAAAKQKSQSQRPAAKKKLPSEPKAPQQKLSGRPLAEQRRAVKLKFAQVGIVLGSSQILSPGSKNLSF